MEIPSVYCIVYLIHEVLLILPLEKMSHIRIRKDCIPRPYHVYYSLHILDI